MSITVTLGRPADLTPEETQQRIRRATEVLDGVGWVFDEHVSSLTRELLDTADDALVQRDQLYRSIRAAVDLKGRLVQIVASKAFHDKKDKRNG